MVKSIGFQGASINRYYLTDDQWSLLYKFLRTHSRVYAAHPESCRHFLNGVLWILRSGSLLD